MCLIYLLICLFTWKLVRYCIIAGVMFFHWFSLEIARIHYYRILLIILSTYCHLFKGILVLVKPANLAFCPHSCLPWYQFNVEINWLINMLSGGNVSSHQPFPIPLQPFLTNGMADVSVGHTGLVEWFAPVWKLFTVICTTVGAVRHVVMVYLRLTHEPHGCFQNYVSVCSVTQPPCQFIIRLHVS